MALNFPVDPSTNPTYEINGVIYSWDGVKWTSKGTSPSFDNPPLVPDENGNVVISGALTVGDNLTASTAVINGSLGANSADITADLTAANTTLSGNLSAVDGTLSGNLAVTGDINDN